MAVNNPLYYYYIHVDLDLDNIGEFIKDRTSIAFNISLNELMSFRTPQFSNHELYVSSLTKDQKLSLMKKLGTDNPTLEDFNKRFIDSGNDLDNADVFKDVLDGTLDYESVYGNDLQYYPMNSGLALYLPIDLVDKQNIVIRGRNIPGTWEISQHIYNVAWRYFLESKSTFELNEESSLKQIAPYLSVFLWSKSWGTNKMLDISDYVQHISTNVGKDGGTFEIGLTPISGIYDKEEGWIIDEESIHNAQKMGHAAFTSIYSKRDGSKREKHFFENVIQSNDILFIQYEELDIEKDKRQNYGQRSEVEIGRLGGRVYDMIGLVDSTKKTTVGASNDISISVSGRDLMKLVTDDGAYYYPLQFVDGEVVISQEENAYVDRRVSTGELILNATYSMRSLSYSMQLIFSILSNMTVCPEGTFDDYKAVIDYGDGTVETSFEDESDQISKNFILANIDSEAVVERKRTIDKIKGIVFNSIYEGIIRMGTSADFPVSDIEFNDNGEVEYATLSGQDEIFNLTEKCLEWGEAHSDVISITDIFKVDLDAIDEMIEISNGKFFYTRSDFDDLLNKDRKDQLTEEENRQLNSRIEILRVIMQESATFGKLRRIVTNAETTIKEVPANGIWSLVKLYVDADLRDIRVVDPSISYPDGSLVDYMRKLCQEPFVEFWGDTMGLFYEFIVRKPPFNSYSMREIVDLERFITITDDNIISDNLSFDDSDIYTWFEIQPKGYYNNKGLSSATPQLPVIQFKRMVDIWGCKRLKVTHQYLNYDKMIYRGDNQTRNHLLTQGFEDLIYLIDSHIYMPFVRKGSITINGDRRIKRGSFIYLESTGEIFHVDNVQQNLSIGSSIDRTTILQLSRGMVKDYIKGKKEDGVENEVSYFNIVDTQLIKKFLTSGLQNDSENGDKNVASRIKKSSGLNEDVFDFFLRRRNLIVKTGKTI